MFGNLRLCEIPPTLLSYQVLPKQIQFVTHVFPLQLEKRNPNFKRFLFYELPFKFSFHFTDTANSLLFFTNFAVFSLLSYFLLDALHSHLWCILYNTNDI